MMEKYGEYYNDWTDHPERAHYGGWVTPEGIFYACPQPGYHTAIISELFGVYDEEGMDEKGWVKLYHSYLLGASEISLPRHVNQKQIDILFDWAYNCTDEVVKAMRVNKFDDWLKAKDEQEGSV
jgi:hypothetical protein